MKYTSVPSGVCARMFEFELDGEVITNVKIVGGCPRKLYSGSKTC
ncbi:MAG: TSCPD domain-containing protein [Clostridia bacterium]|nr:TSCPD domain-containing protein [Clostridia bacterium]